VKDGVQLFVKQTHIGVLKYGQEIPRELWYKSQIIGSDECMVMPPSCYNTFCISASLTNKVNK